MERNDQENTSSTILAIKVNLSLFFRKSPHMHLIWIQPCGVSLALQGSFGFALRLQEVLKAERSVCPFSPSNGSFSKPQPMSDSFQPFPVIYAWATAGTGKGCCSICNKPSRFSAGISEAGTAFPTVAMTMGKWGEHHTDAAHPQFWIKPDSSIKQILKSSFLSLPAQDREEEWDFEYVEPGKMFWSILGSPSSSWAIHGIQIFSKIEKMAQEDAKGWIMQMAQAELPQCHHTEGEELVQLRGCAQPQQLWALGCAVNAPTHQ